jgi:aryl-alcohol dehydrogenase-like predicted oxidoreductase
MHYRLLGKTGLYVSELGLGTMTFGGKGHWEAIGKLTASEAESLIGTALDEGVNFIDTADVYSEGEAEKYTGKALASLGRPREEIIIATKVRGRTGTGLNQVGLSRKHIMHAVDASLKRLGLDYIDLYQIHGFDYDTPIEETVRALDDVVRSGKVRYIGYSNLAAWQAMKALAYAEAHGLARFASAQMFYSIAGRDIEREVVPLIKDQGLALFPWSPLAGGLLSGKFDLESPGPANARRTSYDFPPVDHARAKNILRALHSVKLATGHPIARVALAWLLTRPYVTSIITGAKTREQLVDNLAATNVKLTPDQVAHLDAASALPQEYPEWMLERVDRDRRPASAGRPELKKAA